MEFICVPIIVICCYLVGEIYKVLFKTRQDLFKLIPILVGVVGGILGVLIYYTEPKLLFNADSVWTSLGIGIVSGISSTGTNQIIKQILKREDKKNENKIN